MPGFFITGTDTEIGKTFCASALMHALQSRGVSVAPMKPIAAGTISIDGRDINEDVAALLGCYEGDALDPALINPYCFAEPIAPHIAAARENRTVEMAVIEAAYQQLASRHDVVLVEGAGGFLVPLDADRSMAEIPQRLKLAVILVVGMRLGCINHALLTVEAIAQRGLVLAGWIANTPGEKMHAYAENIATLRDRIAAPLLGEIGFVTAGAEAPGTAAKQLDVAFIHPAVDPSS